MELKQQDKKSSTKKSAPQKLMTPEGPLGDLIQHTTKWTNNAISTLFDNVDTQLFEMAEKSENATDQNIYFDAMRIIRLSRSVAYEEFVSHVAQGFKIDVIKSEKPAVDTTAYIEDLSLVADESLEEDLATHNMIAKAERDNKESLIQLNQRLAYLYKGLKINVANNPMGPTSLCNSFVFAVNTLKADIKVKLLVFKLFDINLITHLHELYEQANKLLIDKGVLPDLKITYKGVVKRQAPPVLGGLGGLINKPVQGNPEEAPQDNAGLSQFMQQPVGMAASTEDAQAFALIQQLMNQNKPVQGQFPQAQYASTDDVMASLAQLQTSPEINNIQGNGAATSNLLKEALNQSIQSNQHKQAINQNDDNLIDVIGMLFDFILDDNNLVDSVKSLLSRLQIPIIKIALQDRLFFRNKNHPARKLLNELANAGLGVTDNVNSHDNPLYLKLSYIVNVISNEQTKACNTEFFDELLEDLHRFITQLNLGLNNKTGPSKDAALKLVTTELNSRISSKELPNNIILLLDRVWKDVMFDIFFTDGMESDEWDMAMTFVDTLVWSIDPKKDIQGQKQLVRVIPGILNALNSGLDRIHYPKELREQILQDLQNCHLACMKGKAVNDSELSQNGVAYTSSNRLQNQFRRTSDSKNVADEPVSRQVPEDLSHLDALDEEDLLASLEDASEQAITDSGHDKLTEDTYTQQARNLTGGAWVEFHGDDNKNYRAKISWMSEDASAYIFVTQTGQIAEKSLAGLSNALRSHQATILDESPVFERAMDAVLEDLQEKTEH